MSKYNKPGGTKGRAEQKDEEARDKQLLAKVAKLTTMFKSVSLSTVSSTSAQTEQPDRRETRDAME